MKLLVTGISGFVGQLLAEQLTERGDEVVGTYFGDQPQLAGVRVHALDVLDGAAMAELVEQEDPDAILHLAGLSHVGASWGEPASYFQVNFLGTERLLSAAAGRRVVFASSAEVYGAVPEGEQPIREERLPAPLSPYALTKACAEQLCFDRGAVVARAFNLIGPGQAQRFALPNFAAQLAAIDRGQARPLLKVGNLSARRDFVHVADGCQALRLLAVEGEPGVAYNIASGHALPLTDVLERLMQISGVKVRVETEDKRLRPTDLPLLCGDPSRLEALGWQRERSVDDALADLWQAARGAAGGG